MSEGPLARLNKLLGIDANLAPIAAVKRIEEMPRRLNVPNDFTDTEINTLTEHGKLPEATSVAELLFHTNKRRRMVFDRVPVGHDTGYRCYDGDKHDADSAFDSGEYGDGMSEDEAYAAWLSEVDPAPRPRMGNLVNGGGGVQPPEYDEPRYVDPDEAGFDADLTDRDE